MSNHTPGPWILKPDIDESVLVLAGDLRIARILRSTGHVGKNRALFPTPAMAEANAFLIQQAPEMFDSLLAIREIMGSISPEAWTNRHGQLLATIVTAIRRARGES